MHALIYEAPFFQWIISHRRNGQRKFHCRDHFSHIHMNNHIAFRSNHNKLFKSIWLTFGLISYMCLCILLCVCVCVCITSTTQENSIKLVGIMSHLSIHSISHLLLLFFFTLLLLLHVHVAYAFISKVFVVWLVLHFEMSGDKIAPPFDVW